MTWHDMARHGTATPLQSAADTPMSPDEEEALQMHGFRSSALGEHCPTWLKKFTAMQVRSLYCG